MSLLTFVLTDCVRTAEAVARENSLGRRNVDWIYASHYGAVRGAYRGRYFKRVHEGTSLVRLREIDQIERILKRYAFTMERDKGA